MTAAELHANADRASTVLKAMSNARRLHVLFHIAEAERSVGELERMVGLSQSALSQHLARLRRDGLVRTRRSAQTVFYSLNGPEVPGIIAALRTLYAPPASLIAEGMD
jgi:ArsR family transcriptional regulator, virulence genes transcriptional regulator